METENEPEYNEVGAWGIFFANVAALICYLAVIINSNSIPDSVGAFILFCHICICIIFAIRSKRPVWWVSAGLVALPFLSLLTSY